MQNQSAVRAPSRPPSSGFRTKPATLGNDEHWLFPRRRPRPTTVFQKASTSLAIYVPAGLQKIGCS